MKHKLLGFVLGCVVYVGVTQAAPSRESIIDVDIITRQERGANESWRHKSSFPPAAPFAYTGKSKVAIERLLSQDPSYTKLDKVQNIQGGKELYRSLEYRNQKKGIIIHHTVSKPSGDDFAETKAYVRSVYHYHTIKKGWGDIGYNFLIDKQGRIYEGKAGGVGVIGAHSKFNNNQNIGIALIGNYETDKPTKEMIDAVVKLSAALARYYGINPHKKITVHKAHKDHPYVGNYIASSVMGHRDSGWTLCPGKNIYNIMGIIRENIVTELAKPDEEENDTSTGSTTTGAVNTGSVAGTGSVGGTGQNNILIEGIKTNTANKRLQYIYDITKEVIPSVNISSLNQEAQEFIKTHGIKITHPYSPILKKEETLSPKIEIYNKETKAPYTGPIKGNMEIIAINNSIETSDALSEIQNGQKNISIKGKTSGASVMLITLDKQVIYAMPILVEEK